jgi:hypothetical protein
LRRIETFLQEEEVDDWACSLSAPVEPPPFDDNDHPAPVGFSSAVFRWPGMPSGDSTPSRFELGPLDVKFIPGALTIISGATASGKSAFLAALLGGLFSFVCTAGTWFITCIRNETYFWGHPYG